MAFLRFGTVLVFYLYSFIIVRILICVYIRRKKLIRFYKTIDKRASDRPTKPACSGSLLRCQSRSWPPTLQSASTYIRKLRSPSKNTPTRKSRCSRKIQGETNPELKNALNCDNIRRIHPRKIPFFSFFQRLVDHRHHFSPSRILFGA